MNLTLLKIYVFPLSKVKNVGDAPSNKNLLFDIVTA
ncbi:MAG: hypothetical protein CM15mV11_0430 [Caudoviricetes sp.]|nr:MAG: hypothetical protein CM15mV11_0430 [Caudoviricetes sp.]